MCNIEPILVLVTVQLVLLSLVEMPENYHDVTETHHPLNA
jgi:hypothetical protein